TRLGVHRIGAGRQGRDAADLSDASGEGADHQTREGPRRGEPLRPGMGRILRGATAQEDGADACGSGTDQVSVGRATRTLPKLWSVAAGGRAVAGASQKEAEPGWRRWPGQPGVVTRQLPPSTTQQRSWDGTGPRLARDVLKA